MLVHSQRQPGEERDADKQYPTKVMRSKWRSRTEIRRVERHAVNNPA